MIPLMKNAFLNEFETREALSRFVLRTPRLSMDEKCFEFEKAFSGFQSRRYSILFNSGASANLALLQAVKNLRILREGARVGFSALTWATNVMPIIQLGFSAVPVDCDPNTLNVMSRNLIEAIRKHQIESLFITNALGFSGDLDEILNVCQEENVVLLEDNCESLGSSVGGRLTGNFGLASTFSFFVAHHMSTIEGGMVCTDDEDLADMLKMVRANGWDRNLSSTKQKLIRAKHGIQSELQAKYSFYDLAFNLRPTEITGFLGLEQLKYLQYNIGKREKNYSRFEKIIISNDDLITLDRSHMEFLSSFCLPILCKTRDLKMKYVDRFSGAGVEIRPMIAGNIANQPFFRKYCTSGHVLVGTDFIDQCGFYAGNYPELSDSDIETILACLHK